MSDDYLVNRVLSTSSGLVGRSLNAIGPHHIIIDSPSVAEEITSGDAFLAGISSCGVNLCERVARELAIPVRRMEVAIAGYRHRQRSADFERIEIGFRIEGVSQAQAETLVGRWTAG